MKLKQIAALGLVGSFYFAVGYLADNPTWHVVLMGVGGVLVVTAGYFLGLWLNDSFGGYP